MDTSNHRQQPNRHLSLDMGSTVSSSSDPTEMSNLLLLPSSSSKNGVLTHWWDMISEPLVCLAFCLMGWYGPKALLPSEEELLSRPVPYQTTNSGEVILDFTLNQPHVDPPTVPSSTLVQSCVWLPVLIVVGVGVFQRNHWNLRASVSSLLTAIGCSEGLTQLLKLYVSRKRPNFYQLCQFDLEKMACKATLSRLRESQLSFPSGHTSLSFCSMTFLVWFFLGHVGLARPAHKNLRKKQCLALISCIVPWSFSALVSASRLVDHWHHPSDVLAGCLLGSTCATFCYHLWYPHVFSSCADIPYASLYNNNGVSKLPSFHE